MREIFSVAGSFFEKKANTVVKLYDVVASSLTISSIEKKVEGLRIKLREVLAQIDELPLKDKVVGALGVMLVAISLWLVFVLDFSLVFLSLAFFGIFLTVDLFVADVSVPDVLTEDEKKFLEGSFSMEKLLCDEGMVALKKELARVNNLSPRRTVIKKAFGENVFKSIKAFADNPETTSNGLTLADLENQGKFRKIEGFTGCSHKEFPTMREAIWFIVLLSYISNKCFVLKSNGGKEIIVLDIGTEILGENYEGIRMAVLNGVGVQELDRIPGGILCICRGPADEKPYFYTKPKTAV